MLGCMTSTVPRLRPSLRGKAPGLAVERRLWEGGADVVVGMDEVGRGAWAGPIAVGAAVVPVDRRVYKVRDSKQLTEPEREALFDRVGSWCRAWSVGMASHLECDELGMSAAQRLAAERALDGLGLTPDWVVVDGPWDFVGSGRVVTLVGGDRSSLSVAAASVLAKVTRDRHMRRMATHFPAYGFEANKGYPGPVHRAALQAWGPSSIHRRSWAFMDDLIWSGVPRRRRPDDQLELFPSVSDELTWGRR